nr:unnamed protein product [Callosobruchus analis]
MRQKGVFPYSYLTDMEKFKETALPPKECFYDELRDAHISQADYNRACTAWSVLGCKTLGDYSDKYLTSDVLLLADVFENYRELCLKTYRLPRLELCGIVLLANLMKRVTRHLNNVFFWTDSEICLSWIKDEPSRWKQFVANRVQEIQNLSNTYSWNHVRSEQDPADLLSRGVSASNLIENELWWFGPEWFRIDNREWQMAEIEPLQNIPEAKTVTSTAVKAVLGYILRFSYNCKANKTKRKTGFLQPVELDYASKLAIKIVQMESFSAEYKCLLDNKGIPNKSKILSLNPFLHDGLLRVGGRLKNSNIPFTSKHQIILPNSHVLTKLILRNEHERLLHCSVQQLMFSVRQQYWPIAARSCCKYVINKCVTYMLQGYKT